MVSDLLIHGNTKSNLFNWVTLGSYIRAQSFDYERERSGMSKQTTSRRLVEQVKSKRQGIQQGNKLFIVESVTFTFLYRDSAGVQSGPQCITYYFIAIEELSRSFEIKTTAWRIMGRPKAGVEKLRPIIFHLTWVTSNRSVSRSKRSICSLRLFCNDNMVLDER